MNGGPSGFRKRISPSHIFILFSVILSLLLEILALAYLKASFFTALQGSYPSAPRIPVTEPSETSVATLVSMGFDRDSAIQALVLARNDINTATNMLLESQSR
ncbi:hypothetical protein BHM03_00007026 [Ensete ventricosum]|nr:hypothetical protein BHM03_00007026 [Ensete ventricosum]